MKPDSRITSPTTAAWWARYSSPCSADYSKLLLRTHAGSILRSAARRFLPHREANRISAAARWAAYCQRTYPADIRDNPEIQTSVIRGMAQGAKRLVFFGSSCVSEECPQPIREAT